MPARLEGSEGDGAPVGTSPRGMETSHDPQPCRTAWRELAVHLPWLAERLERVGHDASEAEDLAQEAVLRGAQKRGDGVVLGSPRGWLLVVARNLGRDLRRRRERIGVESLDALAHEPCVAEVPEGGQDGLDLVDLHDAFLQLAPRDRLALTSWTVHEGAAARVAEDLGVRRELVKVRLFRARQRLRRALETLGAGA